jgi:hypothetical protein
LHQPTTKEKILGEAKSKVERFLSEDLSWADRSHKPKNLSLVSQKCFEMSALADHSHLKHKNVLLARDHIKCICWTGGVGVCSRLGFSPRLLHHIHRLTNQQTSIMKRNWNRWKRSTRVSDLFEFSKGILVCVKDSK